MVGSNHESLTKPVVFVIDDDICVREYLELLIHGAGWQVETFASAREFLSHPPVLAPHCLVLDLSLPDMNGLELQERISVDPNHMPIIFISGYSDVATTVKAMKAGAVEFLTKPFRDETLLTAIQHAIGRSRDLLGCAAEMTRLRKCYASLSRRESEVMALVVSGRLNKQVANEMDISEVTVKAHRGHVMRKMTADSLADLVRMAARLGIESDRPPKPVSVSPRSAVTADAALLATRVPTEILRQPHQQLDGIAHRAVAAP
jgi:FixJ family two-component response regulator